MKASCFKPISLGQAVENLKQDSDELEIWPIEILPTNEGELLPETLDIETTGLTPSGEVYRSKIKVGTTLKAKWLGGDNRTTPPNVRRGERIVIYTIADSNQFFWRTLGADQNLRRLETIIWAFSANPNNSDQEAPSPDNSYFFEMNTHEKVVTFQTSMMNGEKAKFTFQLNLADGIFTVTDEKKNYFYFDSVNTVFRMENIDKSFFEMNKKIISMFAEEFINVKTDILNVEAVSEINIKTKATKLESTDTIDIKTTDTTLESSNSISIKTATTTLESGTSIDVKTGMFNMDAGATASIKAGVITLDGPVMTTGPVTAAGPIMGAALAVAGGGGAMSGGGALSAASAETKGPVNCAGVNSTGLVAGMPVTSAGKPVMTV